MPSHKTFYAVMAISTASSFPAVASPTEAEPAAAATKSSPGQLVEALHSAFGYHHARAVHTKGILLEGKFEPAKGAARLTKAVHLQRTASKVVVRFSDFTGLPDIPDNAGAANPRGLAIRFTMPNGISTDIVSHSFNGFPTPTSDQFRELLLAIAASGPTSAPRRFHCERNWTTRFARWPTAPLERACA